MVQPYSQSIDYGIGNGVSASNRQDLKALDDLQNGLNETFTNDAGDTIQFVDLKPGQQFKITFADGVVLNANVDPSGLAATVTLPSGVTKTAQLLKGEVTLSSTVAVQSDKQTITQLQRGARSGLQLFTLKGKPLKLSSLQKVGAKFNIKIRGTLLVLRILAISKRV